MNTALLVGINKYYTPGNDLRGCINDVLNFREVLTQHCSFSVLGIKTLLDSQATKLAIMVALNIMVKNAVKGDHLVYQHSSHGSQVQDLDGDEPDQLDEILCPYDFDWAGNYIADDELRAIFSKLKPGVTLDVILDSCHSGTAIRNLKCETKFIEPIYDLENSNYTIKRLLKGNLPTKITLWSGCRSDQTSADASINGTFNGAMTYYFCDELRKSKGEISRSKLYSNLKKAIKKYAQVPQLESSLVQRYKRVFR